MEYTTLGNSGIRVSRLGYGTAELRGEGICGGRPVDGQTVQKLFGLLLDSGVNCIDTAPDYGAAEEWIGKYLAPHRDQLFLATKCGCTVLEPGAAEMPHVWTPARLAENLEASLRRMRTDRIDLWQLHNAPLEAAQREGLVEVMQQAKREGKVRLIGVSTRLPWMTEYLAWGCFDAFQVPWSAFDRANEPAIEAAHAAGAGILTRGAAAQGEPGRGRGDAEKWRVFERARLADLLEEGETPTSFLIRMAISLKGAHVALTGSFNPDHLAESLRAAGRGPLSPVLLAEVRRRSEDLGN